MGRPPGVKNGQGKKAKAKGEAAVETEPREAPAMEAAEAEPDEAAGWDSDAETEAEDAPAPVASIAPGANGTTPELLKNTLTGLEECQIAQARVNAKRKRLKKDWKAAGGTVAALMATFRSTQKNSADEAAVDLEEIVRLHAMLGIQVRVVWDQQGQGAFGDVVDAPPQTQADVDASRRLAAARAYGDGHNSGMNGGTLANNPFTHAPGSEQFVEWQRGCSDAIWEADNVRTELDGEDDLAADVAKALSDAGVEPGTLPN
jgi:hypothetical protein